MIEGTLDQVVLIFNFLPAVMVPIIGMALGLSLVGKIYNMIGKFATDLPPEPVTTANAIPDRAWEVNLYDFATPPEPEPEPALTLPAACPKCSGPVYPDPTQWIAPGRAMCSYCGSVLEVGR